MVIDSCVGNDLSFSLIYALMILITHVHKGKLAAQDVVGNSNINQSEMMSLQ